MKINFKPINFRPKLHFKNIFSHFALILDEIQIKNDEIYALVEKITDLAYPTYENELEKSWEYFYVPIKGDRNINTTAIPAWITENNKEFFVTIKSFGTLHIKNGQEETEKIFHDIFTETLRFVSILRKDERILEKTIPYDLRTGKIKGCHVLKELILEKISQELISQDRKKNILDMYEIHIEKNLQIKEISLNEYLNIAAICYKATAAEEEVENLSNIDMYKKWSNGRDGGMLSIKDWDSKNEFYKWYHSGQHAGSYPFEIISDLLHLYPPDLEPFYVLRLTGDFFAWCFLIMVEKLIEMQIPFITDRLDILLDFIAGDTYFTVNNREYDSHLPRDERYRCEHHFEYWPSIEYKHKYFQYIEWDGIKVVKWKSNI